MLCKMKKVEKCKMFLELVSIFLNRSVHTTVTREQQPVNIDWQWLRVRQVVGVHHCHPITTTHRVTLSCFSISVPLPFTFFIALLLSSLSLNYHHKFNSPLQLSFIIKLMAPSLEAHFATIMFVLAWRSTIEMIGILLLLLVNIPYFMPQSTIGIK